jgi:DNA (cytosine-5)-methyltransferase 1
VLKLLDLFCGAGGCSVGFQRAGFSVTGVDIAAQPHYPLEFHQADALEFVKKYAHSFDVIAASPPCQAYTHAQRIQKNSHPDLVADTRAALIATGKPWIMENVSGAPLYRAVTLCGASFKLRTYRHRLFESSVELAAPKHQPHLFRLNKMGRRPKPNEYMHVVGNFIGIEEARAAMGISWMTRDELREAVPPAYTEFLGRQIIDAIQT